MKNFAVLALIIASIVSANVSAAEEDFNLAAGHFGVELDMMPGGQEQGSMLPFVTYETDRYIFSLGGNYYQFSDKLWGDTHFWQGEARAAIRRTIAPLSFLDLGFDYSVQWGKQGGNGVGTNFSVGPLVGFSRQFPHTNVFFTAFVEPIQYMNVFSSQSKGTGFAYFNNGGIGVRYMF